MPVRIINSLRGRHIPRHIKIRECINNGLDCFNSGMMDWTAFVIIFMILSCCVYFVVYFLSFTQYHHLAVTEKIYMIPTVWSDSFMH